MSRLTRRAEADGVKAVWYGNREVFLEGEPGYAEADKLAHYEDLEEQGRLIEMPCKVGDTVWAICHDVSCRRYWSCGIEMGDSPCIYEGECVFLEDKVTVIDVKFDSRMVQRVGSSVFLTKAEAEAKLEELKEGGGDEEEN